MNIDINIPLTTDPITHKMKIADKIKFMMNIRENTQCTLYEARNIAENIEQLFDKVQPSQSAVYTNILTELRKSIEHSPENLAFLLDVLNFMKVTSIQNLTDHGYTPPAVGSFNEDGTYNPL